MNRRYRNPPFDWVFRRVVGRGSRALLCSRALLGSSLLLGCTASLDGDTLEGGGDLKGPDTVEVPTLGTEGSGNAIDHDKLFECTDPDSTASPPRVWRLTAGQYNATVRKLAGKNEPLPGYSPPFGGALTLTRFSNYASSFGMTDIDAEFLLEASEAASKGIYGKLKRAHGWDCLRKEDTPPDDACADRLIRHVGATAFRRPLTDAEVTRHMERFAEHREVMGAEGALETAVNILMALPETVFRMELGDGQEDETGRSKLTPYELATLVSFTVADVPPDDELLKAAGEGALSTKAQVAEHVRRLMGEQPDQVFSVLRFFREYWRYPKLVEVFQAEFNSKGAADHLVQRGDEFVRYVVQQGGGLWQEFLRSPKASVNDATKMLYGLPKEPKLTEASFMEFPERFGMLGQPAWLFAHSQSDVTDPIHRGKFVYESILCNDVPDIPIDVVPMLPEMEGATQRERLAAHTQDAECRTCHKVMDPIGLGFEAFDHIGRYRTEEQGKPVVTTGELIGSKDQDGPFDGLDELTAKLLASKRSSQCFVRHAFRYWMGRNESLVDACSVVATADAFASNENIVDLVAELLTSDSVLYRRKETK